MVASSVLSESDTSSSLSTHMRVVKETNAEESEQQRRKEDVGSVHRGHLQPQEARNALCKLRLGSV